MELPEKNDEVRPKKLSGVAVPTAEAKPAKPKKSDAGDSCSQKTPKKPSKKKSYQQDEETSSDNPAEQTDGYLSIKKNIIVGRPKKTVTADNVPVCTCAYQPGMEKGGGCGADCINRMVMIECNPKFCPLGQYCTNQRFQKREYPKLHRFKTEQKGFGIMIDEDVPAGTFIIEYVGEVISNEECNYRLERANKQKNFYFLTMDAAECIDATRKGNLARFINHSCNPNCQTQKWLVNSEIRVGIFAQKSLKAGTELTFDYQFERLGAKKQVCYCGESNCRGYLGAKKQKPDDKKARKAKASTKKKSSKKTTPKKPQSPRQDGDSSEEGTGEEEDEESEEEEKDEEESDDDRKPRTPSKKKKRPQEKKTKQKTPKPSADSFGFRALLKSIEEAIYAPSSALVNRAPAAPTVGVLRRPVFLRRNLVRSIQYHKKLIDALLEQNAQARPRLETPKVPLEKLIRRNLKEMGMLSPPERRKSRKEEPELEPLPAVGEIGSGAVSFEAVSSSLAAAEAAEAALAKSATALPVPPTSTNSQAQPDAPVVETKTENATSAMDVDPPLVGNTAINDVPQT